MTTTWHRRPKREPVEPEAALFRREKPNGWTSDQWATPWTLIRELEQRFGPFDLDPAAQEHTAKAPAFHGGRVRTTARASSTADSRKRGRTRAARGRPARSCATSTGEAESVVMLLPASVDTGWFHDLVLPHADVQFLRGRVRFIGWEGTPIGAPKAPSILAVYRRAQELVA